MSPGQQIRRSLWLAPQFVEWTTVTLPGVPKKGVLAPLLEMQVLFQEFVLGSEMGSRRYFRRVWPLEPERWSQHGVWEMRTNALRLFGWAPCVNHAVVVQGEAVDACHDSNLYQGHRNQTIRFRDALDLDEPKFLTGMDVDDVFPV